MSVKVNFAANDAGFTSTVKKVNDSMKGMDDGVKNAASSVKMSFGAMVKAGAALAVGFGAIKMAAAAIGNTLGEFKAALDLGGELSDLSARTGETAGNLMLLRRAFDNSGAGADKVGPAINKLQKFMEDAAQGSEKNTEALTRLGLSYDDLKGKTPTEQMEMLAERISTIEDPAQRAAAAIQIFGKSGGELLPLLTNFSGELENAKAELGSMPGVMNLAAETFDSISDNLNTIKGKFLEFAAGLLSTVTPALELITTLIKRIDTAAIGMRLGDVITGASNAMGGFSTALEAIKLGEFGTAWEITWSSIKLQAADSINSIWANIQALGGSIMAFFGEMFRPDGDLGYAIKDLFEYLGNSMGIAVSKALIPIMESLPGIGEGAAKSLQQAIYRAELDSGLAAERMKGHFSHVPEQMIVGLDKAKEKYGEILSNGTKLIDTTKMEVDLQKTKAQLLDAQAEDLLRQVDALEKADGKFNMMDDVRGKSFDLPFNMMDHLKVQKEITKELKEQLSVSQEMAKSIAEAAGKDSKGGRIQDKFKEAIGEGNLAGARRQQRNMERNEMDEAIQKAFGGDGKFGKSVKDIAKDQGIDTFGKSSRELRKELADKAKERQGEMVPGKGGKPGEVPGQPKPAADNPMDAIRKAVDAIQKLVEKIEPKLPTAALGV